jgi:hypothetical protein
MENIIKLLKLYFKYSKFLFDGNNYYTNFIRHTHNGMDPL